MGYPTVRSVRTDDGTMIRTWTQGESRPDIAPVVLINGGPGLRNYLGALAPSLHHATRVHWYDQRGTGESPWAGTHTVRRHVDDIAGVLDGLRCERAVLVGHSFGTELVSRFVLNHPDRVAGVVYLCGPFIDPWREEYAASRDARLSDERRERLSALERKSSRSDAEEREFLALSWITDHADSERALGWASESAVFLHPINWSMNQEMNADKRSDPIEIDRLAEALPPRTTIIGGSGDPRPIGSLLALGERLRRPVVVIPGAGHSPWLERPVEFESALRTAALPT